MKSVISLFTVMLVFCSFGQDKFGDRIYFGGGGGFSSSSNQTNISLSPQVGYKITDRYSAGVGIIYQYVKIKQPIDVSLSNYGWSVFNRYQITQQFFGYAEFERLNYEFLFYPPERTERFGYNSLFVGAGYAEQLGGKASFSIMALYNVLYDEAESPRPYNSPWVIRAGIGIGIF